MDNVWWVILAYLLGAIPTGYLIVRWRKGQDIREVGSGNIGATNVVRAMGFRVGMIVLLIDAGKAYLAVWLAGWFSGGSLFWMSAAGVAVMVGNAFSVFLNFTGGKGFATATGLMFCLAPLPTVGLAIVFLGTVAVTRHISAGSIITALSAPLSVWLIEHPPAVKVIAVAIIASVIVWRHRENIRRLRDGTESVFSFRR
jgi:acyl phosphate:glycerol-3-phosphate acyltransferase